MPAVPIRIENTVGPYIADKFTRVDPAHLGSGFLTKVKYGTFGCDDYHLLFTTIFGERHDLMSLYNKGIYLAQLRGKTGLSNQEVASIIEGIAILTPDEKHLHAVKLEGFWRAKPPTQ